jgi:predicted nucleic acid-binding protein
LTLLDTSVVIDRVKSREHIKEDITAVTFVEYPRIIYYKHFYGGIVFPIRDDFILAHRIQLELLNMGSPQAFADLLVAAIAINRDEEVVTRDKDFKYIQEAAKRLGYSMKLKLL